MSIHSTRSVKSSGDIYKHLHELEGIQRSQQLQILKQKILFSTHTSITSFSSGSRIEATVWVSACPSLTERLSRGQMFPGQMLAVSCCEMLPLESSHCFGTSRRHGILVSYPKHRRLPVNYRVSTTPQPAFLFSMSSMTKHTFLRI